jgi:hypothetical protein
VKVSRIGGSDGVAVVSEKDKSRINDVASVAACQKFAGVFSEILVEWANIDA